MKRLYFSVLLLALGTPVANGQVPQFKRAKTMPTGKLSSLDPGVRRATAASLARMRGNSAARQALENLLLQDPDASVRQAAAVALARIGGRSSKRMLAYASICDPDPATRQGLAAYARRAKDIMCHAFAHPRTPNARMPAGRAATIRLLKHPLSGIRLRALRAAVQVQAKPAYRVIWDMATKDPYHAIRVDALRAAAPHYRAKMAPLLRYTITRDPDQRVRAVGLQVAAYLKLPDTARLAAAAVQVEPDAKTRRNAVVVLAKLGGRNAVHQLALVSTSHRDENTRLAAVQTMLTLPGHKAYVQKVLARVLSQDRSGKVRAAALAALSANGKGRGTCAAFAQRINDPETAVRRTVVKRLSRCPASVAWPALSAAVKDDRDPQVRHFALTALAARRRLDERTRLLLTQVLDRDGDAANRRIAFDALLRAPIKHRAPMLASAARSDASTEIRTAAAEALGKLPSRLAVPPLASVLQREAEVAVRLAAVRSLGRYSNENAYNALRAAATSDKSAEVRMLAAKSASKSPAQRAWVIAMLARTLDSSPSVRLTAASELCALRVPRSYRALVRRLWLDPDASVRTAVARCFSDIDSPLIDVALSVAHASDQDGGVLRTIEISQKQRLSRVKRLLAQARAAQPQLRSAAVSALLPGPNGRVRQLLEQLLAKDPDATVRRAAANKIYRYADQRALGKLMLVSQSEQDPAARSYVLRLYDDLRRRWASAKATVNLANLLRTLERGSSRDRVRAARTLGTLRDRKAFHPLRTAARSSDPKLRYAAVLALATYGDVKILSQSARGESDKATRVQMIQVNYLRSGPEARLLKALQSKDEGEALRAVEAAAVRKVKGAVPLLARLTLSHLSKAVRRGAARALVHYESPLAYWTVRVASSHDASKKLRRALWGLAVIADPNNT